MRLDIKYKILFFIMTVILLVSNICYAAGDVDFNLGKTILKLIFHTLIFIGVIIIAIYGTKFIARNSRRFINSSYTEVIDLLKLDPNTKISIIKVNKVVYVLAMTNNAIEVVDRFEEDQFEIKCDRQFEDELNRYNSIEKNVYMDRIQKKINGLLNNSNKLMDEEEKSNEKMD